MILAPAATPPPLRPSRAAATVKCPLSNPLLKFKPGYYQIVTRRLAEFPLKRPRGRRTGTSKRSPGSACGYRGALSWMRRASLIFGTEPMALEAEAEAALLADELLARLVFAPGLCARAAYPPVLGLPALTLSVA